MVRSRWLVIALAAPLLAGMVPLNLPAVSQPLADAMLAAHNAVRARVGVRRLVWSEKLAKYAQQWADTLVREGKFNHHANSPYGENLFEVSGAEASPAQVVDSWASEAKDYDPGSNQCRGMCGHYTQIVWRDTKAVGCAVARRGQREVWVCNYDPPGNYVGQRPY